MKDYNNCYGMPQPEEKNTMPVRLRKNGDLGYIEHIPNEPLKKNGVYKVLFPYKQPMAEGEYRGKQLELL